MNFKTFWRIYLCILFVFLISCGISEQEIMQCVPCQDMGPFLKIRLEPPVKESVEIQIKTDTKVLKGRCEFNPPVPSKITNDLGDGVGYSCSGTGKSIAPSSSPTPRSHRIIIPSPPNPEDLKSVNINEFSFWGIKEKDVQVILRNLAGDVLAQQNFKLSTEIYPGCSNKYPNCTTTEITLQLSKPTTPTPTPISTPSP